jgi:hypothetical protein
MNINQLNSSADRNAELLRQRDRLAVERALPGLMMFLMMEQCKKIGMEMRADVMGKLNIASAAPFSRLDDFSISRVAKRTDDMATTLLRDTPADDPREGLYITAMFALVLVEEGRMDDKANMAVLVALLLMEDVKDEEPDANGFRPVWTANESKWKAAAKQLLTRAMIMGLYQASYMQLIA